MTLRSRSSSPSLEDNQLRSPNFAMLLAQSKIPAVSYYLDTFKSWKKMPTKPTNKVSKRSRSPPILPTNGGSGLMNTESFPASKRTKLPFRHTSDHAHHGDCSAVQDHNEVPESSSIIVGSCLYMCPESERSERERKGDLDQYERLDGERNRSSKLLAVKKYTRTAAREAELIRPMPILLQTMDYLLSLLNKPYDDKFLGLYNFLWDRMRAVRMDLRMQHIYDLEAISMLEQMIRLHIIAMHELCEYTKGEGFSEGFDAHLNIEQMNKTSVELFHLYDDHRKEGHDVPTEREFRGYYALLKLDKHPGYKVEPAELSLDLAKMTPDMRQTPEIVFSRDVARACRTGNYITFFRLARKASYLQACLMHAHFAKLRTQALAALHRGLQNNQGIPVSRVAKWLGMEEEEIESLLVYYGLAVKEFEEPYMVKEGSFVNVDNDYPVKRSRLVDSKKSRTIVEDVFCVHLPEIVSSNKELKDPQLDKRIEQNPTPHQSLVSDSFIQGIDEDIRDYETISYPEEKLHVMMPQLRTPMHTKGQDESLGIPASPQVCAAHCSPEFQQDRLISLGSPKHSTAFKHFLDKGQEIEAMDSPFVLTASRVEQERLPVVGNDSVEISSVAQHLPVEDKEDESLVIAGQQAESDVPVAGYYDEEAANAKLRLIIRIWKRYSSKRRELREQKQLAAKVALSSLSVGPPICQYKTQPKMFDDLNIDDAIMRWYEIQRNSCLPLNVSDVVVSKLVGKNTTAKCLCWKVVLCSQGKMHNITEPIQQNVVGALAAWSWLLSKLIPNNSCTDDELVVSSPGLSIWKTCVPIESERDLTSCFSVIKEAEFQNLNETAAGASALVFLVLECIPWEVQKKRLDELLMALPSGSSLPLLVLSSSCKSRVDPSTITEELGLHDIDKSRVKAFNILFLKDEPLDFFSDNHLRRGLEWLADVTPPQPVLDCIKPRERVLYHLNRLLEVHGNVNPGYTNPNAIISAFNESLDQSAREVAAAAQAVPACWPCPEIALLGQCGNGNNWALLYLPSIGWSSAARIQQIVHAITTCKLPAFEEDVSWLHNGTCEISDIETKIVTLENCLLKYFTETSKLMGRLMAETEANIMLQKYTQLEMHNYSYYLVPNWVTIFRRAFNWQLMNLADNRVSSAYVLKQQEFSISPEASHNFDVDDRSLFSSALGQPSLDEMLEVWRASLTSNAPNKKEYCFETQRDMTLDNHNVGYASNEVQMLADEMDVDPDGTFVTPSNNKYEYLTDVMKKMDKLSELLEKCNIAQNKIEEKLWVYF